jgi:hypothetical protein
MIEKKIKKAIETKRLKLAEGKKYWYNYVLVIQELQFCRNNWDGYLIDVYEKHLMRIEI